MPLKKQLNITLILPIKKNNHLNKRCKAFLKMMKDWILNLLTNNHNNSIHKKPLKLNHFNNNNNNPLYNNNNYLNNKNYNLLQVIIQLNNLKVIHLNHNNIVPNNLNNLQQDIVNNLLLHNSLLNHIPSNNLLKLTLIKKLPQL